VTWGLVFFQGRALDDVELDFQFPPARVSAEAGQPPITGKKSGLTLRASQVFKTTTLILCIILLPYSYQRLGIQDQLPKKD
jgi:hypothetical protein